MRAGPARLSRRGSRGTLLLLLALSGSCRARQAAEPPPPPPSASQAFPAPVEEESVAPGANERFLAPDLDVEEYVQRFEGESREIAARRDAIVAAVGLHDGQSVADVGAGTGLFLDPFVREVGPHGHLRAVELSPAFVRHLEERVREEGLDTVEVVQCTDHSATLPPASCDVVFVCDTYHHFEYPRSMLASLHAALRPGGTLVLVDFERVPGVSSEWILGHVRAGKETVIQEVEAAGFRFVEEVPVEGLTENYLLRFVRA